MKHSIKVTGMEITMEASLYLEKKMASLDKLIDQNDTSVFAQIEIGKTTNHHNQGELFKTEINLHIAGTDFRIESEKDSLYTAIDIAKDHLYQELQTYKRKKLSIIRRGGAKIKNALKSLYSKDSN
jgi:ribosomal subunit interface protein